MLYSWFVDQKNIYVFHFIINIIIRWNMGLTYCSGLGHKTMAHRVCLTIIIIMDNMMNISYTVLLLKTRDNLNDLEAIRNMAMTTHKYQTAQISPTVTLSFPQ